LIFSSTCAVYGNSSSDKISENQPCNPINPYGISKLRADKEITNFSSRYGINALSFRFFNVAGAYKNQYSQMFGEAHKEETHLIPRIIESKNVDIYGFDLKTPDGTCVRDYVHVVDLARAIEMGLRKNAPGHKIYNLGSGLGKSVLEVVQTIEILTKSKKEVRYCNSRVGDPAILVADPSLVKNELGWETTLNFENIISSSFDFHRAKFH
jgi:UDP-glucose 4-epimerase